MIPVSRLLTIWAVLLALLAFPAAAFAQSAGDDQYSDPLAGSEQPSGQGGQPQSGSGQGSPPQTGEQAQSAPTTSAQSGTTAAAASSDALPRTGLDVVLLFAAAAPLLLGGFALRRVAREV